MNTCCSTCTEHKLLLCETCGTGFPVPLIYRLYAVGEGKATRFLLSVEKADERCEVNIENDLLWAVAFYQQIVKGNVTPCTLQDIIHDLQYWKAMEEF